MLKLLLSALLLGTTAAYHPAASAIHRPTTRVAASPACVEAAVEERTGALGWARGRVVATRNIFKRAKKEENKKVDAPKTMTIFKKKVAKQDDLDMQPIFEFAGALLGATASGAAAATAATCTAVGNIDLTSEE